MFHHQKAKEACSSNGTIDNLRAAVKSAHDAFDPFDFADWLLFACLAFQSGNNTVLQFILDIVDDPFNVIDHIRTHCTEAEEERVNSWKERTTNALRTKIHGFAQNVNVYNNEVGSVLRRILYRNTDLLEFAAHKACEARNPPMFKDVLAIIGEDKTIDTKATLYSRLKHSLDSFKRCGYTEHIGELSAILEIFHQSYKKKSDRRFRPY
jgi:hypothetical protein